MDQKINQTKDALENEKWEDVKKLTNQIYIHFNQLIKFVNYKDLYVKYKINVFSKYFDNFNDLRYYDNVRDNKDLKNTQKYWRQYLTKHIDPSLHIAYKSVYGYTDARVIH